MSVTQSMVSSSFDSHWKSRAGNWALCLLWSAQATLSAIRAFRYGTHHNIVAAVHVSVVAVALFIFGMFFLVRSPAVKRAVGFPSKCVAFLGTWTVVALAMLPVTAQSARIEVAATLALILVYCWVTWALMTLRRNISIFPEARSLVRHGPYGLVRHPLYSAYIVCYAVIAIPRLSLWAVLLAAIGIVCEILRARSEERLLANVFSDYSDYALATPRFIPSLRFHRTLLSA